MCFSAHMLLYRILLFYQPIYWGVIHQSGIKKIAFSSRKPREHFENSIIGTLWNQILNI